MFETILRRAVRDGAFEFFAGNVRSQANHDFGAGSRTDGVPHFGLAAAARCLFMASGVLVVRVNLHGELVFREDEFNEQREKCVPTGARASPLRGHSGPCVAELLTSE